MSYVKFRRRIHRFVGRSLADLIWEFYWPGYEQHFRNLMSINSEPLPSSSLTTAINYHKQVPKAITFGRLLGEYLHALQTANPGMEVVLIGHSLGCRLILEALRYLQSNAHQIAVSAIVLMAAAVPVESVALGGTLRAGLEFTGRRFAVFSRRDIVLSACFPVGQTMARDGGLLPKAVGWCGLPSECWTGRQQTQLTHGQYWSDEVTTPRIVHLFGKAVPLQLPYFHQTENNLPQSMAFREWRLSAWNLPDAEAF